MRKLLFFSVLLFFSSVVMAQEKKNFNFILVVNEKVWITNSEVKIEIKSKDGLVVDQVNASYYPGNLAFVAEDYLKLLNVKVDSMEMSFDYYGYSGDKQVLCNFRLPFFKNWLDQYFIVMRVYNLDDKEYKGVFDPLDNERNYTYELDYPGGQMLRVRNKVQKKNHN